MLIERGVICAFEGRPSEGYEGYVERAGMPSHVHTFYQSSGVSNGDYNGTVDHEDGRYNIYPKNAS
jgi:hypothetical protein